MAKKKKVTSKKSVSSFSHKYEGKLALVIPLYNESDRISLLIKTLKKFDTEWKGNYEVILVNDGSKDNTKGKLESELINELPNAQRVELINLETNKGKGNALVVGVEAANADHILTLDADMATKPQQLFHWLKNLPGHTFQNDQILIGSREHEDSVVNSPSNRKFIGWIFNWIIQFFTSLNFRDTQCGFKLYPATIAKELFGNLKVKGWAHDVELLYKAKLNGIEIKDLPVNWTHMDGAKIDVVKDGFKMFWQSLLISVQTKLDWFFISPFKNLTKKSISGEHPIFRFLFAFLTIFLFILMPYLSKDFGITGDEVTQRVYGDKLLKHAKSGGENQNYLEWKNLKYYGGLFDYVAAALNPADNPNPPDPQIKDREEEAFKQTIRKRGDVYDFRHWLNSLTGVLLILFSGLLAVTITNSWRLGLLTMLFMVLSPRIFGHSMNNPKDIPFAAAYTFALMYIIQFVQQLPRPGVKAIVFAVIGIAATINIRVGGLLLIGYLGLFTGIAFLAKTELRTQLKNFKLLSRLAILIGVMSLLSFFGGMIFWPYAKMAPFSNPFEALSEMSNFSTGIQMLYGGGHYWSDELPWYYIPSWIAITAPIFYLLGLVVAPVLLFLFRKDKTIFGVGLVAFAGIFPLAYAVLNGSSLYDGLRHFIFIYPCLAILAAWAWNKGFDLAKHIGLKAGLWIALLLLMALPLRWMVKNHPYQYVYFNEIFGGVDAAFGKYETDYWMNSMKGLCDWFLENVPEAKAAVEAKKNGMSLEEIRKLPEVKIATNCAGPVEHYLMRQYPNIRVYYVRYHDREERPWKYALFYSRFINQKYLENGTWPPKNVIYEEKVDNTLLAAITKRDNRPDYEAYELAKVKDYPAAIAKYEEEIAAFPDNEAALTKLANVCIQSGDLPRAKRALDQSMALSDEHVTTLGLLGLYYMQSKDIPNAKKTFEKAVSLNYKYHLGYFYLANIAGQANDLKTMAINLEKYDINNGNIPAAFDMAINLWSQKGNQARAQYYQAKKLYLQGKGSEALQLLKQSLAQEKDYEPAQLLMEKFEKIMKQQQK